MKFDDKKVIAVLIQTENIPYPPTYKQNKYELRKQHI